MLLWALWFCAAVAGASSRPRQPPPALREHLRAQWSQILESMAPGAEGMRRVEGEARRQVQDARRRNFTPHFVLDRVFSEDFLRLVASEIPEVKDASKKGCLGRRRWRCWKNDLTDSLWASSKNILDDEAGMGPATQMLYQALRLEPWLRFLQRTYRIGDPLIARMDGAGIQNTANGGFLGLHVDFNWHLGLQRRINLFIYLNDRWQDSFGGELELWNSDITECGARILPSMGRVVSFQTTDFSWHGQPHPLSAPANRSRRSVALYYYTERRRPRSECREGKCDVEHSTLRGHVDCARCRGPCCAASCGAQRSPW
mmetsp:Transcript_101209/g.301874  ORF Transcript_101209/g.301874 Transcript_101209/m.301874 type:complete len:315 (-) Transcript_101209:86-1030(-)|eukprot:CAMPEP_0175683884 /NCGR_PEP_ID=MMETSP0097-20121207/26554_1 /TAXON_ID=311494 /ORGANISM="Alexandrium monilatum, Strain CCMP3105" /LENGTH=314 /DNA_ID=CAMNT_0016990801 /DNA_START=16 /DNA_END=960 /DNA_ORIENTATION=-